MADTMTEIDSEIKQQELRQAKQIVAGATPLMEQAADSKVVLARGLYIDNAWETEVYVRELTGVDEENLARFKDIPTFLDAVITYGTDSIGSVHLSDKPFEDRQNLLRELLVGEREQLFLQIARVSFGDMKSLSYTCGTCDEESEVDISLSKDIKIPEMKNPQQMTYEYTTSSGDVVEYSLVTGWDQHTVNSRKGLSVAETNTILLSNIIQSVDGHPVVDPLGFARRMSMRDRRGLVDELVSLQPNPDTTVKVRCSNCEAIITLDLTWELVFRP